MEQLAVINPKVHLEGYSADSAHHQFNSAHDVNFGIPRMHFIDMLSGIDLLTGLRDPGPAVARRNRRRVLAEGGDGARDAARNAKANGREQPS
jgi:hypothetical protein